MMEPEPSRVAPGPEADDAPERAVVAADEVQRALAEIWSGHPAGGEADGERGDALAEAAGRPSATGQQSARGDFAQRALAEIWSAQPGEAEAAATPANAPTSPASGSTSRRTAIKPLAIEVPESAEDKLELAGSLLEAGHADDAIPLLEAAIVALQSHGAVGPDDGDGGDDDGGGRLAAARGTLARAYLGARRPALAIGLYELLLAESTPAICAGQRLGYRISLAQAFRAAGQADTAIDQLGALVAELDDGEEPERLLDAQIALATTYVVAQRMPDAITAYERALTLAERLLGSAHRRSLSVRLLLARSHQEQGESQLAIDAYGNLVADAERALGPTDTLTQQAQTELTGLLGHEHR